MTRLAICVSKKFRGREGPTISIPECRGPRLLKVLPNRTLLSRLLMTPFTRLFPALQFERVDLSAVIDIN